MAIDKLQKFRNITYDYKDDDDVFIARGLQLNTLNDTLSMVIDQVNAGSSVTGNQYEIPVSNAAGDGFDYSEGFKLTDGGLDQYGRVLIIGSDSPGHTTRTDAAVKVGEVVVPHYNTAEEPVGVITGLSTPTINSVSLGGGSFSVNAVTLINFYAASNTTTVTGTRVAEMDINGLRIDTIGELTTSAGVTINNVITMPGLGDNDTEDHVIAINDATGLLTKRSVASIGGGGTYTAGSGLTLTTTVFSLGGILTSNAAFTGAFDVSFGSVLSSISNFSVSVSGDVSINYGGIGGKDIQINASSMLITDGEDAKGLQYAGNYDTAGVLDDDWIPSYRAVKAYADSVSGTPYPTGSGIPIIVSGTSWGTTITDNSTNWDSAYSHISLTNNPHSVDATDILPAQATHSGEFLTTDGATLSWVAGGGGGTVTSVTSTTTSQLTVANGTTTPALTIVTGAVTNTGTALATGDQIYDFVIGQGYSTTVGTVYSIVASTTPVDGLSLSGGTITGSGTIALSGNINVTSVTGTLPVANGGTGLATVGVNYVLTGNGTGALSAEANMTFSGSVLAVTGTITATGEITGYASDERLKTAVVLIPDAIEKLKRLNGVTFEWRPDVCARVGFVPARDRETGFIAQNLASVIEDAVAYAPFDRDYDNKSISGEDYLTTMPEKAIPLLVEAVKALIEKVEQLENK